MVEKLVPDNLPHKISRQEREGKNILERFHERNPFAGGALLEVTGMPGVGKSSVLLAFINYILNHHPEEKVFFSNSYNSPLQVVKLKKEQYQILIQKDAGISFYDRIKGQPIKLNVIEFDGFENCYEKSKEGMCNCIFFGSRKIWMDWIGFLISKHNWSSVFIDEMSELIPETLKGEMFKKVEHFSNSVLAQVRKCNCIVAYNTQCYSEVSWKVRRKLTHKLFLPGAKADGQTRVQQKAIDNLPRSPKHGNQGIIDNGGIFGYILFSNIYENKLNFSVEARTTYVEKEGEKENGRTKQNAGKTNIRRYTNASKETFGLAEYIDRKQRTMVEKC